MDKSKKRLVALLGVLIIVASLLFYTATRRTMVEAVSLIHTSAAGQATNYRTFLNTYTSLPAVPKEETYTLLLSEKDEYRLLNPGESCALPVDVKTSGLYAMKLVYQAIGTTLYDYDISIQINGVSQYDELNGILVKNSWEIDKESFIEGKSPNLIPQQGALETILYDRNGYYSTPLQIYLPEGQQEILLTAGEQEIGLYKLILYPLQKVPSYSEYESEFTLEGGQEIFLEGEYAAYRSRPSILELSDSTSSMTSPPSVDKTTMNTIGGDTFSSVGDSLTWQFTAEESGLYTISMRVRQDFTGGSPVYRRLLIDGETLFTECESTEFSYQSGFAQFVFGGEQAPYKIALDQGPHTITLEVVYGSNAAVIEKVNVILQELNTIYRRILMLTGANPDPYRDYLVEEKLPDVLEQMQQQCAELQNVTDYLRYVGGAQSSNAAVLSNMVRQLTDFEKNPENIPAQLSTFDSNISAIATWVIEAQDQPLEIDWLCFTPANEKRPDYSENILKRLSFGIQRFLHSFTADYALTQNAGSVLEVWTAAGRDQAQTVAQLIEDQFFPETGISVNLKLIQAGTLLPAVVSGIGPDISIMNANADAVNFASRHAVMDLSAMNGFDELASEFYESALCPMQFLDGVYGIPEQQTFPVLFYRTDILNELNLTVPETWDEAYNIMFELQKNNMEFGVPTGLNGYALFLYQFDGELYTADGTASLLDSDESVKAFSWWTSLFSDLSMPMSYNFVNRFRSGEMPIGIADYTTYNTLTVFAPEIHGLWDMALVPGVLRQDGTINRSTPSGGTCSMIMSSCEYPAQAWQFLRWWCRGDTQRTYGTRIETKLGASARYPAANRTAFENLMWTPKQLEVLQKQFQYVRGIPEVPGGYFTSRHVENSFRQVVINNKDVKETLQDYSTFINAEITNKRHELKIDERGTGA